jgi:hypothetical protein
MTATAHASRRAKRSTRIPAPVERSEIRRPTSDDWYPNLPDGTVTVMFVELSTGQWRVCVWGGDDCGMERDFAHVDRQPARRLYDRLAGCSDVTKQLCHDHGMTCA